MLIRVKKFIGILIVIGMLAGMATYTTSAASVFSDVPSSHINYEAISALTDSGVLSGYPSGEFRPENNITRAEFTAVLSRERHIIAPTENAIFIDVPDSHWAKMYINSAYEAGVINGVGNGRFDPESPVTYEQVIKMVVAALGYNESAIKEGGYPNGYLSVGDRLGLNNNVNGVVGSPASRAMVAQIVYNGRTSVSTVEAPKTQYPTSVPFGYSVDLYTNNPDDKIYYTVDGSTPTINSNQYKGIYETRIYVNRSLTLKAIAVDQSGNISDVAVYDYKQPKGDKIYDLCKFANDTTRNPKLNKSELEKLFNESMSFLVYCYDMEDDELDIFVKKCKEILKSLDANSTEFEKEYDIFEWLILNTNYDQRLYSNTMPYESYTAYGLLINGVGVCEAYAEATQFLLTLIGIDCQKVIGMADGVGGWGDHAWNIVKINDKYYHLDTTWRYFNYSDEIMKNDHIWDEKSYPACVDRWEMTVPDVVGMTEYEAYNKLQKYGFCPGLHISSKYTNNSNLPDGKVISQSIPVGKKIPYIHRYGIGYYYNGDNIEADEIFITLEIVTNEKPKAKLDKTYIKMKVGETVTISADVTPNFYYEWFGMEMRAKTGTVGYPIAYYEPIEGTTSCRVTAESPGKATLCLITNYAKTDKDYYYCEIEIID